MTPAAVGRSEAKRVADAGDAYAASAGASIEADLAQALVVPSAAAVKAAMANTGKGAIGERVADALAVNAALAGDVALTEAALDVALTGYIRAALLAGWEAGVREVNETLPDSIQLAAGDASAALLDWPILGHTPLAIAAHNAAVWRFGAEGVLGSAASVGDPTLLLPGFADLARRSGNRAAAAIGEAYASGAGAARIASAGAVVNAAQ